VKRERGFVLLVVVFFTVMLFAGVATFLRRATLDAAIVRNRDYAGRAEALARGGIRLGVVLLQQDLLEEQAQRSPAIDSAFDLWARAGDLLEIPTDDGGTLRLRIEDAAARISLNGLANADPEQTETEDEGKVARFLVGLFGKVIEETPELGAQKRYDPEALTRNLIDYLDEDDVGQRGEREEVWYQQQDPPYRTSPAHVLLSVDELALVQGFDAPLVDALRPYVTVFPLAGGGVNPNTAPPWVLAALDVGDALNEQRGDEEFVRRLVKCRGELPLCESGEGCQQVSECLGGPQTPTPPFTFKSDVFRIEARAQYGDVRRVVEAVVSRKDPANIEYLAWRVR